MKKRGLSGVVTVILIILLVLVAVGIIWAAIRPPIEETGERLSGDCLTLDVEPVSCTNVDGVFTVSFIRNAGAGDMSDVRLVVYSGDDGAGNTNVTDYGQGLTELQTGSDTAYFDGVASGEGSFNVAAVIQPGETPVTCEIPESRSPINCN